MHRKFLIAAILATFFAHGADYALAATVGDTNIFSSGATAAASTSFGFTFDGANLVDGLNRAHVFADGVPNPAVSITGFNSAIDTLRFFDTPSYSERIGTDVSVHYSAASTSSFNAADYTLLGNFPLDTIDGAGTPPGADYYSTFTNPADFPCLNCGEPAVNNARAISFSDANGLGIPAGTQSLLMVFTPSAIFTNQGIGISEIQAFETTVSEFTIDSSLQRAVFQRTSRNDGMVPVTGSINAGISAVEARAIPRTGSPGTATAWQVIDSNPTGGSYAGELELDAGWYDVEVRSLDNATVVDQRSVERVGVGEVFVIAGQSNSANWGSPPLAAQDDRVSSFDLNHWRHADDPQPIADNNGGSPWPALGDAIAADQDVPVGFISVGVGGTRASQWRPGGSLYPRLQAALEALGPEGARAVLWHQGEADNEANTSTADYELVMEAIIAQSRVDAGFDIPWGIAQASYLPYLDPETDPNIIAAQALVAANDPLNFVGASTDDLINLVLGDNTWRHDDIHFNEAGLREHAARWFQVISEQFSIFDEGIPGDFNNDGIVDGADFTVWRDGLGTTYTHSDYDVWVSNFGTIAPQSAVPEPGSNLLLLCALVGVRQISFRRRFSDTRRSAKQ